MKAARAALVMITAVVVLAAAAPAGAALTERASVATGGAQANNNSLGGVMTPNGRYVAFQSFASNLVTGDTNGRTDIFVRDRRAGITRRVSIATDGTEANHESFSASITPDGRYVAFESFASNLVTGDGNGTFDVFVHDTQTGDNRAGQRRHRRIGRQRPELCRVDQCGRTLRGVRLRGVEPRVR